MFAVIQSDVLHGPHRVRTGVTFGGAEDDSSKLCSNTVIYGYVCKMSITSLRDISAVEDELRLNIYMHLI